MGFQTRARYVPLLAALALLAGCQLRADVELRVDRGGGGALAVGLAADEDLEAEARAGGFDLVESVADAAAELDGWEAASDDGKARLETSFADPRELRQVSGAFADALAAPELRPLEPFEVTVTESHIKVRGGAGLQPTGSPEGLGVDVGEAIELLDEGVEYTVVVELPGEVVAHNADFVQDSRLTWEVPPGGRIDLTAEAALPPEPARWPWWLAAAVALGLLVTLVVARRGRRRRAGAWSLAR